jgi:hypothetical protein
MQTRSSFCAELLCCLLTGPKVTVKNAVLGGLVVSGKTHV